MQITTDEIIQIAYRLIRKKTRNIMDKVDDKDLGNYVRGVVDLQAELYGKEIEKNNANSN